jgi:hypothetical protein
MRSLDEGDTDHEQVGTYDVDVVVAGIVDADAGHADVDVHEDGEVDDVDWDQGHQVYESECVMMDPYMSKGRCLDYEVEFDFLDSYLAVVVVDQGVVGVLVDIVDFGIDSPMVAMIDGRDSLGMRVNVNRYKVDLGNHKWREAVYVSFHIHPSPRCRSVWRRQ